MADEWGPLAPLRGEWTGEGGLDTAFSHGESKVIGTPYRERAVFNPFGPVRNGRQALYGLDYRASMWRANEENPFHTEVGYWLWDADTGEILRGFVVPRGIAVLAGGIAEPDATTLHLKASVDDPLYTIGENRYLRAKASTTAYEITVTINPDGTWSYEESATLKMAEFEAPLAHTDHNTLHLAG